LLGALLAVVLVGAQAVADSLAGVAAGRNTPPPTPVGPKASLSPFVTMLRTPSDASEPPDISAPAAVLADLDTGQILFARNPNEARPIASVTKIMTALLVLGHTSPADVVTVSARAAAPPGSSGLSELGLEPGERITVGELTWALLLQSANDAAAALAEDVAGTVDRFVQRMNTEAQRLGMSHTRFRSASGLDDRGHSSAEDLVTLTRAAFAESPRFAQIIGSKTHDVPSPGGKPRHLQNRNVLLWLYPGATGVKTGYTAGAGFCIVATAARAGRRLIAVVLGDGGEPFSETAALLNYGFEGFAPQRFVEKGVSLGTLGVVGGAVPVEAGAGLTALVPTSSSASPTLHVITDPAAAYPPARGAQIAVLEVSIPGLALGTVPVVVAGVPSPPSAGEGTWWSRAAGTTVRAVSGVVHAFFG